MNSNPVSPKVTAAALAAAVGAIVVWALGAFAGIDVPPPIEGAFVVLLTFGAGYLKRDELRADHDPNLRA